MEDVFASVDARPKRRQGVTGQTIEAQMRGTMCQITEYELDMLRDEIAHLRARLEQAEREIGEWKKAANRSHEEYYGGGFRSGIEAAAAKLEEFHYLALAKEIRALLERESE